MNYITCGPTPREETCTGVSGDRRKINLENRQWKRQLQEAFKHLTKVKFEVKSFPHDFGTYSEVCVTWEDDEGAQQALQVDSEAPGEWDQEAREALALFESKM